MAKQLELIDTFSIKFNVDKKKRELIASDSSGIKKDYSLICEVNASHAGTLINNRVYPPQFMKKGARTWTHPYRKPVLTNHDDNQDPIGRIIKAKYVKTPLGEKSDDYIPILKGSDGYGYLRLTAKVTDPAAIQKIIDGRYETVSVRMSTSHALCSICNVDWGIDGPCEHTPGQMYDKKLAYITTGDLSYRELSFVNLPADEFAGVKEAMLRENDSSLLKSVDMTIYANNNEEKVLSSLSSGDDVNLYSMLDDGNEEGEDVVLYLLDKSSKTQKSNNKEEEVKLEELTKDQLRDLGVTKELITEEVAKIRKEDAKKAKTECEEIVKKLSEDCKKSTDELKKSLEAVVKTKDELTTSNETLQKTCSTFKKDSESCSKKLTAVNDELSKKDEDRKRVLDENIKINTELHKMIAERLYDLKKTLRKPDVVDIKTPDDRNKKVEEFAQRSIDSLKDQVSDLLLEHEILLSTNYFGGDIENPGASRKDETNEIESNTKVKKPENKKETLNRLFAKS